MRDQVEVQPSQENETQNDSRSIISSEKEPAPTKEPTPEPEYITGFRLTMIMITLNLTTLIAALDLGIVATAIPAITDDFHKLDDIGWYTSICFTLVGVTSAMWGKLFTYLPAPIVYMSSLLIYLVGSIVAAAGQNSVAFIWGRAIQGAGCSGTLSGSVIIINYVASPKRRPVLIGVWMSVLMMATILGPLLGGVFTTELSWRWCFWINLPIGGAAFVMQLIFLRMPKSVKPVPATWVEILRHLDFPGFILLLASVMCYCLALQWGGVSRAWSTSSDGSVIATLVMFIVLTFTFFVCEYIQGQYAMIPLDLFKPRHIWSQALYTYFFNSTSFLTLTFLPIYFQSIKGTTAIVSGVYQLPQVAFFALGAMMSGGIIGSTGHLAPVELVGALLTVIGAALIYAMDVNTSKAWYISAQIPIGIGLGLGNQVPATAIQGFAQPQNVGTMTGGLFVCQTISGGYFTTAATSILQNLLVEHLVSVAPHLNVETILSAGATEILKVVSPEDLPFVVESYMTGIKGVFALLLAVSALSVALATLIPLSKLPSHEAKKSRGRRSCC
ncbi:MFS general substrate transporter [Periconia macrospinosa]|uniref:MFS general substrate transporter n=1 Tax=Periconia macrospinosa TaxID=97972 RepID=A0A2V1DP94_9PLEO|nr:MFS general substrate transporter [Periconia macrospinosa]